MPSFPCFDAFKNTDLHKYLKAKTGIEEPKTKEDFGAYRKEARNLQHDTLDNLHNIYADLKVPGYEKLLPAPPPSLQSKPTEQAQGSKGVGGLNQEGKDLLASIDAGSKPAFVTKNLEKIAKDNGIEVTGKTTADDIINALKEKAKNETTIQEGTSTDQQSGQPTKKAGADQTTVDQTGKAPAGDEKVPTPEVKIGDEFTFADNTWKVTEDLSDKVKATNGEVQSTFPKESVARNLVPPEPPDNKEAPVDNEPEKQWTAIRKKKQIELDNVREAYEKQKKKSWTESLESGLKDLQARYPSDNIYEASKKELTRLMTALSSGDKNDRPVIDDETLAVLQNFKRETSAKISELTDGLNSNDYIQRQAALAVAGALHTDLMNAAMVIKEGTTAAGRTLVYAQSELAFDPQYGLQIRRMQLQEANGGEKLSEAQMEYTAGHWAKEKALLEKEQELRAKGMQETFDKQIADLHKDYADQLKQNKAGVKPESKAPPSANKKTLSQSGKEAADRIRKGKLGGTQAVIFPGVKQAVNLVIEAIAQIVEKGATVAEAIAEFIKDNVEKGKEKEFKDAFLNRIYTANRNTDAFDALKENAEATGSTGITKEMVAKNLIRDYVDSHIGDMEPGEILDAAATGIKKILPDATKEQLIEAYNKAGDYHLETEKKIKSDYEKDKQTLVKLAKIEKDLNDLRDKSNLFKKEGNVPKAEEADRAVTAKEKELEKALRDKGEKVSGEDKFAKASYETRAQTHNQRLEDLSNIITAQTEKGDLTPEQQKILEKLKAQIDGGKVLLDPNSKLSQKNVLEYGLNHLKEVAAEFDKQKGDEFNDIKLKIQRVIDKFGRDREETEQKLKLQRVKDRLIADNLERQRKINAGEFEDKPIVILKKSDAELVRLKIERDKLQSGFNYERRKLENKNRSRLRQAFDFGRAAFVTSLIWKFGTLAKVGATSLIRPNIEAATRAIFGNIFKFISPSISERARAGGESSSLKTISKLYQAYFMQVGEKGLARMYEAANNKYEASLKEYTDQVKSMEGMGKDDPSFAAAEKRLQGLKEKKDSDLLSAVGNVLYQYIGGSSVKDALDALFHRSNIIERKFGFLDKDTVKDGNIVDKVKYILEFVGRSHSAIKTFSGRANFAAAFIARVEAAVKNGEDVSNPDRILEIANESYLDWDRGKYQQSNFISDAWSSISRNLEREYKGKPGEKYAKGVSALLKFDVPITRVPVNILHEAVAEYTVGAFRAIIKVEQVYRAARKEAKAEGVLPGDKEFKAAVQEHISKMDKDQAALIVRCFRKGGFGLGLFALFALGGIMKYGGFHHRNERKKYKPDELKPGEIVVGDEKTGTIVGKIIEHTPGMFPALLGLNTAHAYNEKIAKGKSDFVAAIGAVMSNLEYIQDQIPQTRVINPIGIATQTSKSILRTFGASKKK